MGLLLMWCKSYENYLLSIGVLILEIIPWMIYKNKLESMPCKLIGWEIVEVENIICEAKSRIA